VISSQEVHDRFGGVVPEIAARHHLELIDAVVGGGLRAGRCRRRGRRARRRDARAGPGRRAARRLLRGEGARRRRELPFAPVDHLQGHVAAAYLAEEGDPGARSSRRFCALIASGGTRCCSTCASGARPVEVLARTLDDAAGEAFDKGARMLGLGYPGGAALERLAAAGDPSAASTSRPGAARTSPSPG
jgi:N6-L-threonylcarbamoyladenine synthase